MESRQKLKILAVLTEDLEGIKRWLRRNCLVVKNTAFEAILVHPFPPQPLYQSHFIRIAGTSLSRASRLCFHPVTWIPTIRCGECGEPCSASTGKCKYILLSSLRTSARLNQPKHSNFIIPSTVKHSKPLMNKFQRPKRSKSKPPSRPGIGQWCSTTWLLFPTKWDSHPKRAMRQSNLYVCPVKGVHDSIFGGRKT